MLAVFAPWMVTNIRVDYSRSLFATDASMSKGAVVETVVTEDEAKALWLGGDKKGNCVMLDNPFKQILRHLDEVDSEEENGFDDEDFLSSPPRERPFEFDFVEICGGVGEISKAMSRRGAVVAPVLDLSASKQYNLKSIRLLEWVLCMVEKRRFRSVFLAPPCATFSPAGHPACRSYRVPEGFNRKLPKVIHGNVLAFRSLIIFKTCVFFTTYVGFEQPRRSKMAWLRAWKRLVESGAQEAVMAACQFGSIHQKEFRILLHGIPAAALEQRCQGGHQHVRIEGRYTKLSAIYPEKMAEKIASVFLRYVREKQALESELVVPKGRESLIVNDLLIAREWKERRAWFWKKRSHINVLETSAAVSILREQAWREPGSGQNLIVDSEVARGALAKGRSSSFSLRPTLRRSAAIQIAGDIYPAISYGPTRLNTADAPTRDRPLPTKAENALTSFIPPAAAYGVHATKLCRYQANWARLTLLLCFANGFALAEAACPSPSSYHWIFVVFDFLSRFVVWLFPVVVSVLISRHFRRGLRGLSKRTLGFSLLILLASPAVAPMVPETAADRARADARSGIHLASDRLVRKQTRDNRLTLISRFENWLFAEHGVRWADVIGKKPLDAEEVSGWLATYGKDLYSSGRSYGVFSETINAVSMLRPIVKKQLGGAWDVAFAWKLDEPHEHHPALPMSSC